MLQHSPSGIDYNMMFTILYSSTQPHIVKNKYLPYSIETCDIKMT